MLNASRTPLSTGVLRRLKDVGIVAQSSVSLEHQTVAGRYVLRGIESGGAIRDLRPVRHVLRAGR